MTPEPNRIHPVTGGHLILSTNGNIVYFHGHFPKLEDAEIRVGELVVQPGMSAWIVPVTSGHVNP